MKHILLLIFLLNISCYFFPQKKNISKLKVIDHATGLGDVAVYKNYVLTNIAIIDVSNLKKGRLRTEIGDIINDAAIHGIQVKGNYAYFTTVGKEFLAIADLTNINNPKLISLFDLHKVPGLLRPEKLTIDGDYAYISAWEAGDIGYFVIVDILDVENPKLEGYVIFEGGSFGNAVQGNYAYVAAEHHGMYIIDISNKKEPKVISNIIIGDPRFENETYMFGGFCVAVKGNYAYLTDSGRVLIIDVSDPYNPKEAGRFEEGTEYKVKFSQGYVAYTAGHPFDIDIEGDYAYVADLYTGLIVLDISDPTKPYCVGYYGRTCKNIAVSGNYVYAVSELCDLTIYDISKIKKLKEKKKKK